MTSLTLTPVTLYRSTIGKKVAMAATGLIMWVYVLVHMLGNLKVFTGARHFDEYAGFLRRAGEPLLGEEWLLWTIRTVLLASVLIHIVAAYQLSTRNLAARGQRYRRTDVVTASYASRTMRWSGVIVGLFIAYHLLHLTTGTVHHDFEHGAVFHNVVEGFQRWWVSAIYIAAVAALGLHLYHGTWSMIQTFGRNRPGVDPWLRKFSAIYAVAVTIGFIAVPVAVLAGWVE